MNVNDKLAPSFGPDATGLTCQPDGSSFCASALATLSDTVVRTSTLEPTFVSDDATPTIESPTTSESAIDHVRSLMGTSRAVGLWDAVRPVTTRSGALIRAAVMSRRDNSPRAVLSRPLDSRIPP